MNKWIVMLVLLLLCLVNKSCSVEESDRKMVFSPCGWKSLVWKIYKFYLCVISDFFHSFEVDSEKDPKKVLRRQGKYIINVRISYKLKALSSDRHPCVRRVCRNPLSIQCKFCLVLFNGVNSKAIHHNKNPTLTTVFFSSTTPLVTKTIFTSFLLTNWSCFHVSSRVLYPCSVNTDFFFVNKIISSFILLSTLLLSFSRDIRCLLRIEKMNEASQFNGIISVSEWRRTHFHHHLYNNREQWTAALPNDSIFHFQFFRILKSTPKFICTNTHNLFCQKSK